MSNKKDEIYLSPTSIPKEDFSTPSIPDSSLFGELPDGCQINEFGEIIREKGKSR